MEVNFRINSVRISAFVTELKNTDGDALVSMYTGMAQAICFVAEEFIEEDATLVQVLKKVINGPLSIFIDEKLLSIITGYMAFSRATFKNKKGLNTALSYDGGLTGALSVDWKIVLEYQDKFYTGYQFLTDALWVEEND
jgi:hypothetical protein